MYSTFSCGSLSRSFIYIYLKTLLSTHFLAIVWYLFPSKILIVLAFLLHDSLLHCSIVFCSAVLVFALPYWLLYCCTGFGIVVLSFALQYSLLHCNGFWISVLVLNHSAFCLTVLDFEFQLVHF